MLALLPLILSVAPEVARWLFGDGAEKTTAAVAQVVSAVTGADVSGPVGVAVAQAMLEGKPDLAIQLRTELAKIAAQAESDQRKADSERFSAAIADMQSARSTTVQLASAHSAIAWGAPVLSGVILISFAAMLWIVLTRAIPEGSAPLANVLLGTLAAMAGQVANYWLGSSSGSAGKDKTIATAVHNLSST